MPDRPHVVVLAGGESRHLQSLMRALYGHDLPKELAVLAGERSLLQATVERAMQLTTRDRISVVVTAHHESIAREQLAPYRGVEVIVQPRNLDTGPGLLLPLIRILTWSPSARVIFLPSDHYVPNPTPLIEALSGVVPDAITLVGVEPTGREVECGWIIPGEPLRRCTALRVASFHEKPSSALAEHLYRSGGLWNTSILAGRALAFWDLARRHLPDHVAALDRYAAAIDSFAEAPALQAAYRVMPPAKIGRDLLAVADSLAVLAVSGTGWSDWGSPERIFASLVGTPCHDRLVGRIRASEVQQVA